MNENISEILSLWIDSIIMGPSQPDLTSAMFLKAAINSVRKQGKMGVGTLLDIVEQSAESKLQVAACLVLAELAEEGLTLDMAPSVLFHTHEETKSPAVKLAAINAMIAYDAPVGALAAEFVEEQYGIPKEKLVGYSLGFLQDEYAERGSQMKLDKSKLSQIFTRLLKCKSPQEMEEVLVPTEHRKLSWDSIADKAQAATGRDDPRKAVRLLYSGMVLALKENDWARCYAFAATAYHQSTQVNPATLAETIAITWPILAYCETHCPAGPQPSPLGYCSHILMEEGIKKAEQLGDTDMVGMIALAIGGLSIFQARFTQMIGLPTVDSPKSEAMEAAADLEHALGLLGIKDWVNRELQ